MALKQSGSSSLKSLQIPHQLLLGKKEYLDQFTTPLNSKILFEARKLKRLHKIDNCFLISGTPAMKVNKKLSYVSSVDAQPKQLFFSVETMALSDLHMFFSLLTHKKLP